MANVKHTTNSGEVLTTETDNIHKKHSMVCSYFFSYDPQSSCCCEHCIYSDYEFCPADKDRLTVVCDE